jgi:hypothetical protein
VTIAVLGLAISAAGCRSAAVHYYSLAPNTPIASSPRDNSSMSVRVTKIPPESDRVQLVVHRGDEIAILDNDRWIAPLANELESALSYGLDHRLADDPQQTDRGAGWVFRVSVLQFDAYPNDQVVIAAH